ncbi:MAG TPA: efflux RND transporter periplasmic adaptor subunit [Woeseiaceae bacterium]|nr:efflux RND transporter periplasmic adaptor subunit [Woeseiaceae bacterium]
MLRTPTTRLILMLAIVGIVSTGLLLPMWLGPRLPGYRVAARPLVQTVVATGRVLSVSRVQVGSEITGVVLERRVEEGYRVASGDVLAVLRADDLAARVREAEAALDNLVRSIRPQAEESLREAEARLAQAERETARRRDLSERGLIAREALEQAEESGTIARASAESARLRVMAVAPGGPEESVLRERLAAARAALARTVVRSEVAGIVLTRNAEPGDLVQPGTVLFTIARSGDTELLVPFDEENLALLRTGQRATGITDAYPERLFAAEITLIAPRIDPQRGTVDVRLRVDPVPEFLRQDMTVSVSVETARRERALVVPNDALLDRAADRAHVLAVRDGRVRRTAVRLGLRGLTLTEVLSGLEAGDRVLLLRSAEGVAEGDRVRVVEEAMPTGESDRPASGG